MKNINYQLFVSDFDGTLCQRNGKVSEESKNIIQQYIADGGKFAISTGRLHYGILSQAKELGLKGAISCCNGALILDIQTHTPLLDGAMTIEKTVETCKRLEELDLHIHLYTFDNFYCNKDDEALIAYEKMMGNKAIRVLDKPLSQYALENGLRTYKMLAMVEPERIDGYISELRKRPIDDCEITKSASFLLEIVNSHYSKGTAVRFLADYYGIPLEKTVGIGDQWNDLPMIQTAGLGLAVKNGDPLLKSKATVLDYTNDEGAVAKAVKKYGYL